MVENLGVPHLCADCLQTWRAAIAADKLPYQSELPQCPHCGGHTVRAHPQLYSLSCAHFDFDAFFAAVAKREHPELATVPVIIGRDGPRSVVSTCCYLARMYGVRSAMPVARARKLCPGAVLMSPPGALYREAATYIRKKLRAVARAIEPISIDEAYADLSHLEVADSDNDSDAVFPARALAKFRLEILKEIRLSVSIGLADNYFLAKFASDFDKPKGFVLLSQAEAPEFLHQRNVSDLRGVGPASAARLNRDGIYQIGQIQSLPLDALLGRYGKFGEVLFARAHGWGRTALRRPTAPKSVSNERTFLTNESDAHALLRTLEALAQRVAERLQKHHLHAQRVTLKLRTPDFQTISRAKMLPEATNDAAALFAGAQAIFWQQPPASYRLIGVGGSDLHPADALQVRAHQPSLYESDAEDATDAASDTDAATVSDSASAWGAERS